MPWLAVGKEYEFEGPDDTASLIDLFEDRRQLIVYRAFLEPGVHGWPDHACVGCSLVADQVAHVAHLHARDTTLTFASRAPQADIQRVKARMGWEMPWYTMTDGAYLGVAPPGVDQPAPNHSSRMVLDEDAFPVGVALHAAMAMTPPSVCSGGCRVDERWATL
jgi:hypothetical protein